MIKIDVSVNAPQAGKLIELLVNEEDTVTVGQDLFRIELGAEGEGAWSIPCVPSLLADVPILLSLEV